MDPLYKPQGVEQRWQQTWEEEGLYAADPDAPGDTFVVMHPPPNISGSLTIGHCLQLSLEDTLVRWHRMRGYNTLFQPGYDHAGISTWAAIGRTLAKEGQSQRDLGRDGFDAYVQEWLERYGGTIMSQFRLLGASLDYRRTRFTMDEGYYRAVMRWFVHLYERGWIYRANRIVNWCPRDQTALSDLEVEHEDADDTLSYVRYPLADGSGHVTIATVRPATILADVAVAVHPDDERYRELVGKEVVVPFVERRVPVIADERVEREFGTGALKITPGHDPTDFEIGRDHGLPELAVIGPDGLMNDAAGELAGLTPGGGGPARPRLGVRARPAREARALPPLGRPLRALPQPRRAAHRAAVVGGDGRARRAGDRRGQGGTRPLHARPLRARLPRLDGERPRLVHLAPDLVGAPDSRLVLPRRPLTVAETEPEACGECGSTELRQDEDVLDTWFSSALYPFATLGWPDETPELARFYPGDVLATARDIIFLWVARMIFSGLELLGRGTLPGRRHPLVPPEPGGQAHVADARHRHRSRGGARAVRRRRDAVRAAQDDHGPGPALLVGHDRGGAEAREQALEREPAPACWRGAVEPEARPSSIEERWILARIDATRAEFEADLARVRLRARASSGSTT